MKEIIVKSKKHGIQTILVDDEDYILLNKYSCYVWKDPRHNTLYARVNKGRKFKKHMHRFILESNGYNIEGKQIDHKDRNGLNNCKENLRICTNGQNQHNSKKNRKGGSKYKGVSKHCLVEGFWYSRIQINNESKYLGFFKSEEEAAKAYDEAAKKYFGEFANLNFKDEQKDKNKEILVQIDKPKRGLVV